MKTVRIGHIDFKIIEMDKVSASDKYGMYLQADEEIHLCKGMSRRRAAEVLLHEILHGVVDFQNLGMGETDEERIVRSIANGLASTMRDNQKLFADILKALK